MVCRGYVGAEWVTCQVFTVFIFGNLDIKTLFCAEREKHKDRVVYQRIHFLEMF